MIRVLIAEDSSLAAIIMRQILARDPEIEVIGWAKNGQEAVAMRESLKPDVITMDLNMPVMNGLEAIQMISATRPLPILVVSQLINSSDSGLTFEALCSGAVDVMEKPAADRDKGFAKIEAELIKRIKTVANIKPIRMLPRAAAADGSRKLDAAGAARYLVVIGASTGGPVALASILKSLPDGFPVPIAIVQHIAQGFVPGLAEWLTRSVKRPIQVAQNGESPAVGIVYLAPDGQHLLIGPDGRFLLSRDEPLKGHRPSITKLMDSAARSFGRRVTGVLLTGMGDDGVEGLRKIHEQGGKTIVQDEASSLVFGMPREAILAGVAEIISPLDEIPREIIRSIQHLQERGF
jgi:two-component system chemotaxis response regulator CheB